MALVTWAWELEGVPASVGGELRVPVTSVSGELDVADRELSVGASELRGCGTRAHPGEGADVAVSEVTVSQSLSPGEGDEPATGCGDDERGRDDVCRTYVRVARAA